MSGSRLHGAPRECTGAPHVRRVQRVDARLRLRERRTWREPRDLLVVLAVPRILGPLLVGERQRRPDPDVRVQELEVWRQHADDRVGLIVQPQLPSHGTLGAAGEPCGERVAEHGHVIAAVLSVASVNKRPRAARARGRGRTTA